MRNAFIALLLPAFALLGSPLALAQAQRAQAQITDRQPGVPRPPFERFEGTVILKTKDGKTRSLRVVIRNWVIDNRRHVADFPEKGFRVIQLRGGEVTTIISGKRQQRLEDEFWTVPAGVAMTVETGNESAVMQVLSVTE